MLKVIIYNNPEQYYESGWCRLILSRYSNEAYFTLKMTQYLFYRITSNSNDIT